MWPQTFTVTDVTLNVGGGYQISFVNPQNQAQVYATSSTFEVKASGSTCLYFVSLVIDF
jgi:hypothetical protein